MNPINDSSSAISQAVHELLFDGAALSPEKLALIKHVAPDEELEHCVAHIVDIGFRRTPDPMEAARNAGARLFALGVLARDVDARRNAPGVEIHPPPERE